MYELTKAYSGEISVLAVRVSYLPIQAILACDGRFMGLGE